MIVRLWQMALPVFGERPARATEQARLLHWQPVAFPKQLSTSFLTAAGENFSVMVKTVQRHSRRRSMMHCWPQCQMFCQMFGKKALSFSRVCLSLSCHFLWLRERGLWDRIYSLLAFFLWRPRPLVDAGTLKRWLQHRKTGAWRAGRDFLLISFAFTVGSEAERGKAQLRVDEKLPAPTKPTPTPTALSIHHN